MTDLSLKNKNHITIIKYISYIYLAVGSCALFFIFNGTIFDLFWFVLGWGVSFFNFELHRRLSSILFRMQIASGASKAPMGLGMLLFLKVIFFGLVIAFLVLFNKVHVIPFFMGSICLLISMFYLGIDLLIKEKSYYGRP